MDNRKFEFIDTYSYKLIYVFAIADEMHKNILKIGESTLHTSKNISELEDNCDDLNSAAIKRIKNYTTTIGVVADLLYTTIAVCNNGVTFKDKDVHKVLKNSGIIKHNFGNDTKPEEWYETNLQTVKNAIIATKEGRKSLDRTEINNDYDDIIFRPEQKEAITKTIQQFKVANRMLWNAKMRFGKTLSALEVVKRMSLDEQTNISKTIILTHRPVVDDGWFEDYVKIFYNVSNYSYGSKNKTTINQLLRSNNKFIYFASMQDLRGSSIVGGNYDKNNEVFNIDWDFIIIDEAHEGTQTELGQNVINELLNSNIKIPKQLYLSGTPFNLLSNFEQNEIYTWDYIMEQKAKLDWEENNPVEPNPYEDLPRLNILTYNLDEYLPAYQEVADSAFNFKEFFRVWTGDTQKDGKELLDSSKIGKFIHESDVEKFINLLTHSDENSNYPFSKKEFRENFRHSFWIVPGVKEAKALKELMMKNEIFSQFDIKNIAGAGDENGNEPLDEVKKAIGPRPNETYTITISCGKLTTGVTVKPWTAVLYLAGSYSTSAASYLQTIFRVQSPCSFEGKIKTDCYVFDFAPDRTLKMVAEAGLLNTKAGATGDREVMKQFLNFCPVISVNGSKMSYYNVNTMLQELKKAYIERVVDSGFDDAKIYNDNLLKLTEEELKQFNELKAIIGASKQKVSTNEIDINKQGFNEEEWEKIVKAERKHPRERTEEEKRLLEKKKEKASQRQTAISILRGISIRIPLLVYGANISDEEDITINNFTEIIDDLSWEEFMPRGVSKEKFNEFSKYYDSEIFIGAGRKIRKLAKHADSLNPFERTKMISQIFSTFRNPDKETVLTPWKTVNKHLGDCIGGFNFFPQNQEQYTIVSLENPIYISQGEVTQDILNNDKVKVLEINSKSGLYPLYMTFNLYKQRTINVDSKKLTEELEKAIWDEVVSDNIFVLCKTPMAKSITNRTLCGYNNINNNIIYDSDFISDIMNNQNKLKSRISNPTYWHKEGDKMKFDLIIGNPPYQLEGGSGGNNDSPMYQYFAELSEKLNPQYSSLIMPARWFAAGRENLLGNFRKSMLANKKMSKLYVYTQSKDVFPNVEIKGGVCYYLIDNNYNGKCSYNIVHNGVIETIERDLDDFDILIRDPIYSEIVKKVTTNIEKEAKMVDSIISNDTPFGISSNVRNSKKGQINIFNEKDDNHNTLLYHIEKLTRKIEYIDRREIKKNAQDIDEIKVFIPGAGGSGNDSYVLGKPEFAPKNSVCSQSYLYAKFDSEIEAKNFIKYLKTKFFRTLVASIKISQSAPSKVYRFVPLQNFTNFSDINWNCNIDVIDEQLYKKYDLSLAEIEYINNNIKYDSYEQFINKESIPVYIKRNGNIIASGIYCNGKVKVLKNSMIIDSIRTTDLKKMVIEERNSKDIEENKFINDHLYDNPSRAATVILGQNSNGYNEWKTENNISLNSILNRQ